jgi:hypothetical protein
VGLHEKKDLGNAFDRADELLEHRGYRRPARGENEEPGAFGNLESSPGRAGIVAGGAFDQRVELGTSRHHDSLLGVASALDEKLLCQLSEDGGAVRNQDRIPLARQACRGNSTGGT